MRPIHISINFRKLEGQNMTFDHFVHLNYMVIYFGYVENDTHHSKLLYDVGEINSSFIVPSLCPIAAA